MTRPGPGYGYRPLMAGAEPPVRVLIADDQALVRAGFRAILEGAGRPRRRR